jgi:hypothetical protein
MKLPLLRPALIAAAGLAISGCSTYGHQGYSRVSLGYGNYRAPYYGWYDGYYYPGTGYYIYDRAGSSHRWRDSDRRYWESRRGDRRDRANWSGYGRDHHGDSHRNDRRDRHDRDDDRRDHRR